MNKKKEDQDEQINPIDPDKITEIPGLIPYPHNIGSPAFKPNEEGAIRSASMKAMEEQCEIQLDKIKQQIALLSKQAQEIKDRYEISKAVYAAKMSFEPVVGNVYYLYARKEGEFVLSMVAPDQWGKSVPFKHFVSAVKLLGDKTWQVQDEDQKSLLTN
jgi:hypothetical protein